MFDNIGSKIKTLAKAITWIFIGISVISGVAILFNNIIAGILVIVVGSLMGWIGSFLLYGFGELIETTAQMKQTMDDAVLSLNCTRQEVMALQIQISQKKPQKEYISIDANGEQKKHCPKCGRPNIPTLTYCSSCGSKL